MSVDTDKSRMHCRHRHPSDWQTRKVLPFNILLLILLRCGFDCWDDRPRGTACVSTEGGRMVVDLVDRVSAARSGLGRVAQVLSFLPRYSVFGLGAQLLVTMGLQREKAGRGSLAMYTQVNTVGSQ